MENLPEERQRAGEDVTLGIIGTVMATPVAALLLSNTVSMVHVAEKYGWHTEGAGVAGNGFLAVCVAGFASYNWRKFHNARDKLLNS